MSLFSGFVKRDGSKVSNSDLEPLRKSIEKFPRLSEKKIVHGNAAFTVIHTKTTQTPLYLEDERHLFVAQGRIDNRTELCQLLGVKDNHSKLLSDESLILQTYLKYGEDTPNRVLGDWSFAAYDFVTKRLFLAQNPCGYGSLYYYIDHEFVIFSNSIKPLLASNIISAEIDMQQIIALAAVMPLRNTDETFYKNIKLLNPAHHIWIDEKAFHKERYWFPEEIPLNHKITAEDAANQLKEIFTQAVSCRLADEEPIASMLSGGLDSGSVASIAATLLKEEHIKLPTFSHVPFFQVPDDSITGYFNDERPYIESTVEHNGNISPHYLYSNAITPLEGVRIFLDIQDQPMHGAANAYWLFDLHNQVKEGKFGVLLSGEMGNATISFAGAKYLLKKENPESFLKAKLLRPIYQGLYKAIHNSIFKKNEWQEYSYLEPGFAKKIALEQRIKDSGRSIDFSTRYTYKERQQNFHKFGFNPRFNGGSTLSHYFGFDKRDPTADKRVVEFVLQLPNEIFFSKTGGNKQILKLMMETVLPDKVLYQTKKGLQASDIIERIQPDIQEMVPIVTNFKTDLTEDNIFDKRRMLFDLELLKAKKLSPKLTRHLLRTVGIMEFLNREIK